MEESMDSGQPNVLRVLQSRVETRRYYDKISKVYDVLAEKSEEPIRRVGLEKLAPKAGESILEIGVGTGHCLAAIADAVGPGGSAFGLDLSEKMLHQTHWVLRNEGLRQRVECQCGDGASLPYRDDVFNGIFMSFVLELFDTPEIPVVLAECKRVLHPGGRIVVVGMSKEGKEELLTHVFEWTHQHFPNFLDCRPIFVRRALEAAGFVIKDAQLRHMWIPVEIVLATKPLPTVSGGGPQAAIS
jgi:ubiquinone/menaquinone biosynthesis C-methylase UbiE